MRVLDQKMFSKLLLGNEEAVFEMAEVASLCTMSNVKMFGSHRCCGPSWSAIKVRAANGAKMKSVPDEIKICHAQKADQLDCALPISFPGKESKRKRDEKGYKKKGACR